MNFAFVLGGGAARGAFHLGFLHFCEENKIEIHAYSGSSIGAIISASHASGVRAKEQLELFSSNDVKKALKFNYFKNGLLRIDETHKIIDKMLPIKKLQDIPKPVWVNAYDIKKRELHYFNSGDTVSLCMASSALVPIFKPISYENMYLIDGGLFDNLPIKPLENKGYDIVTIDLFAKRNNNQQKKKFNLSRTLKKTFLTQLCENHIYTLEKTDQYVGNGNINDFSLFTFNELKDCFNLGFKEAQKHFLDIL